MLIWIESITKDGLGFIAPIPIINTMANFLSKYFLSVHILNSSKIYTRQKVSGFSLEDKQHEENLSLLSTMSTCSYALVIIMIG